jgi:hypothetical protein
MSRFFPFISEFKVFFSFEVVTISAILRYFRNIAVFQRNIALRAIFPQYCGNIALVRTAALREKKKNAVALKFCSVSLRWQRNATIFGDIAFRCVALAVLARCTICFWASLHGTCDGSGQ